MLFVVSGNLDQTDPQGVKWLEERGESIGAGVYADRERQVFGELQREPETSTGRVVVPVKFEKTTAKAANMITGLYCNPFAWFRVGVAFWKGGGKVNMKGLGEGVQPGGCIILDRYGAESFRWVEPAMFKFCPENILEQELRKVM